MRPLGDRLQRDRALYVRASYPHGKFAENGRSKGDRQDPHRALAEGEDAK